MALPNGEVYDQWFAQGKDQPNALSRGRARELWAGFGLPQEALMRIWQLSDMDQDGALSMAEHRLAMHLLSLVRSGGPAFAGARPASCAHCPRSC